MDSDSDSDSHEWRKHLKNRIRDAQGLARLVGITDSQEIAKLEKVLDQTRGCLPFAVTEAFLARSALYVGSMKATSTDADASENGLDDATHAKSLQDAMAVAVAALQSAKPESGDSLAQSKERPEQLQSSVTLQSAKPESGESFAQRKEGPEQLQSSVAPLSAKPESGDSLAQWKERPEQVQSSAAPQFAKPESGESLAQSKERPEQLPPPASTLMVTAEQLWDDPIVSQVLPSTAELIRKPYELSDPLGEYRSGGRVVREYSSRLLVRLVGECPLMCRYCFRRSLLESQRGVLSHNDVKEVCKLLRTDAKIRELVISGGDPLTVTDEKLDSFLGEFRAAGPNVHFRICTRSPIALPSRITPGLLEVLRRHRPLSVIVHVNHPRECEGEAALALQKLVESGLPVRSQTVLLAGVNASARVLEELFARLLTLGVHPYYLFHTDLAAGTSHFRIPLSEGLAIFRELKFELSALELPRFAVDLPGGGGKVYLPEGIVRRIEEGWWLQSGADYLGFYPEEKRSRQ